jgi:hypothetical protein
MAADNTIDIVINQKASFEVTFSIKDGASALNLTGYTTSAKLKTDFNTPDAQAITFTTAVANAIAGQITMSLSPAQTSNLSIQRYFYDLSITSGAGFKTRVAEGVVRVSGGVS